MDPKDEVVEPVEENLDLPVVEEGEEDSTDYKAEALKLRDKAIAQRERTKALKKELSDTKKAVEIAAGLKKEPTQAQKTDELSETQLDYLDLKGVSDADDIDVVQKVMQRTGQTVRQALQDDYVVQKLAANKAKREVQDATPGNTKRGGAQGSDLATAIAKFKETGQLPDDYAFATKVADAVANQNNDRLPPWQR